MQVGQIAVSHLQRHVAAVETSGRSDQADVLGAVLHVILHRIDGEGDRALAGRNHHRLLNCGLGGVGAAELHGEIAGGGRVAGQRGDGSPCAGRFGQHVVADRQRQGRAVVIGDEQGFFNPGSEQLRASESVGDGGADTRHVVTIGLQVVDDADDKVHRRFAGRKGDVVGHPGPTEGGRQRHGQRVVADDGAGDRAMCGGGARALADHAAGQIQGQRRDVVVQDAQAQATAHEARSGGGQIDVAVALGHRVIHRRDGESDARLTGGKRHCVGGGQLVDLVVADIHRQGVEHQRVAGERHGDGTVPLAHGRAGGGQGQRGDIVVEHAQGSVAAGVGGG